MPSPRRPSVSNIVGNSELKGFGVRVLPTGLKVFMLQYRNSEGVSKRLKIGRYGVLTPDEACTQAKVHLGDVARGTDPQEARAAAKAAPTIGEICDWYLAEAEAGRLLGRKRRRIKASTLRMDRPASAGRQDGATSGCRGRGRAGCSGRDAPQSGVNRTRRPSRRIATGRRSLVVSTSATGARVRPGL